MKKYLIHFLLFIFPICTIAQQVELAYGVHIADGGFKNSVFLKGERTNSVYGIGVKQIAGNWGVYANWFSSKKKFGSDSIIIYRPNFLNAVDSLVYDKTIIPYGFTIGTSYSFPCRLSLFVGAGLSIFRKEHFVNRYQCHPTATGYYVPYETVYLEKISETSRKISFEILADYDFLKSSKWSLGTRVGYNTQNKFTGQAFFGYNFRKD